MSTWTQIKPDSRRAMRRAVDIPCAIFSARVDEPLIGHATDMSPYGLWVEGSKLLLTGDRVHIVFRPPLWPYGDLTVLAEVVRVVIARKSAEGRGSGMGFEFIDLDRRDRRRLEDALFGLPPRLPGRAERQLRPIDEHN